MAKAKPYDGTATTPLLLYFYYQGQYRPHRVHCSQGSSLRSRHKACYTGKEHLDLYPLDRTFQHMILHLHPGKPRCSRNNSLQIQSTEYCTDRGRQDPAYPRIDQRTSRRLSPRRDGGGALAKKRKNVLHF